MKKNPNLAKHLFLSILITLSPSFFFNPAMLNAQPLSGSYYDFVDATKDMEVNHNPSKLIIYRPQNNNEMNDIRCFLKLEDEDGKDVTYTACTASYEWATGNRANSEYAATTLGQTFQKEGNPKTAPALTPYKKTYYLSGGMAMHLKLKKGKYKISLYTPKDKQNNFTYPIEGTRPFDWQSNVFEYDTENPAAVIFVVPTTNDNGFYNGGWYIDYKAPSYLKNMAVPEMELSE